MRASRLRLNPSKMQVIWLSSSQLIRQVSIYDVVVLSTRVEPVESFHDLGVMSPHSVVVATINFDNCVLTFDR